MKYPSLLLFFASLAAVCADQPLPELAVYELRTYTAHEGKLDALHARFRDHTLQRFKRAGMENVVYLEPVDTPGRRLTYLLGYPSRASREQAWKRFKADPEWQAAYRASVADGKLVEQIESTLLEPTDYSPDFARVIAARNGKAPRLFELRTYTTRPGKLAALDARFRDHTCALFEKHGMTNILYTHPMQGQPGHGNTLVYLIAHKDREARDASFEAFRKDPAWQQARKASEKDGKILVKGGVQSQLLSPTDYSPIK